MSGTGYRKGVGDLGERMAQAHLEDKGYRLLERNYRVREGEIDLIMMDGDCIVFIEVKTRTGMAYGSPGDAVTWRKRERLGKAAMAYMGRENAWDRQARFDVVEVTGEDGQWTCYHLVNAFDMPR